MSTQGTLHFSATLDTSDLKKGLQETQERLKNGAKDTAKGIQDAQEQMSKATNQNIAIQRKVIAELQREYRQLQHTISQTPKGAGKDTLKQQAYELKEAIIAEQNALKTLQEEVKQTEVVHESLRSQMRAVREEMARLDPSSAKYQELQQELGRLKDIQDDIAQAGKVYANDEAQFAGLLTGLQGVAGGFGAVTGAMALFGEENEAVQRSMQRLMATMQVVQGVQAVAQALNKDSAFMLVTLKSLKEAYNKANMLSVATTTAETTAEEANTLAKGQNTIAQGANTATTIADTGATVVQTGAKITLIGVLRTLWATMLSNPITAILAGVGLLIAAIYKMTSAGREADRQQQALNEKIIELASEPVGAFLKLRNEYQALGRDMQAKEQFVRSNAKAFDQLGLSIHSVADAERILIQQSEHFIQAQIAKAKSSATLQSDGYQEELKRAIQADLEIERLKKRRQEAEHLKGIGTEGVRKGLDRKIKEAEAEKAEANKAVSEYIKQAQSYSQEEEKILQSLNAASAPLASSVAGTRLAIEKEIKALEEAYGRLNITDKEGQRKNLEARKALQRQLDALDGKEASRPAKEKKESEEERFAKQMLAEYERAKQAHKDYLRSKLDATARYLEEDKELQEAYERETNPDKKRGIALQRKTLAQAYETEQAKARDNEESNKLKGFAEEEAQRAKMLDEFREKYRSFEEQLSAITLEAERKRQIAREEGLQHALPKIDQEEQSQKSRLALEELQAQPIYEKLFGNLSDLATSELEQILTQFEGKTAHLGIELSPSDLKALKDKLEGVKQEIRSRNPFKALTQGIKDYREASDKASKSEALKQIGKSAEASFGKVNEAIGVAQQALSAFGIDADSSIGSVLNGLQGAISGGMQFAKGMATGNPLDMISGGIGVVTSVFSMFGNKDKEAEKRIKAHQREVTRLEGNYRDLERAVGKALGAEQYSKGGEQIRNLERQQRQYAAMAGEERSKKKSDADKVEGYYERIRDLEHRKAEVVENLRNSLMTTDVKSAAKELGDAFVSAFAKGEDAVGAFSKRVDTLVAGIMRQMVIKQLFEQPIGAVLNKYASRWVSQDGTFGGFGRMEQDMDALSAELKGVSEGISLHGKRLLDKLGSYEVQGVESNSISAEVKGVSETTAKALEGQINALRLTSEAGQTTRLQMSEYLRSMLSTLTGIKQDTSYLKHLESIDSQLKSLERRDRHTAPTTSDLDNALRSQGITP